MRKKKNIILERVTVEDYAAEGKSLARVDGKVVFIEHSVPGDVVDVRLTKSKKDWAEGYPVHLHEPSPDRVKPFCIHFGVCGGCQWQMLPYARQVQFKQKQVYEILKRIGKIELPEFEPIIGAERDKFYRNKLEYTFSTKEFFAEAPAKTLDEAPVLTSKPGALGFHARGFFDKVVEITECWLQDDLTNKIRNSVREFAYSGNISFYDIRAHRGSLRTMQVRICASGEVMVNVVFGDENMKAVEEVMSFLQRTFPAVTTLLYTINLKMNDSMHDLEPEVYAGKGFIVEKLEDFEFKIGPKSFFQTNTYQGERLYKATRELAELDGSQVLYDLYCGTGSIGIFCSRGARKIIGVEAIDAAVKDAEENALMNNVSHAEFFTGDVTEVCNTEFFEKHGRPDVIITDPPRAGMHAKLVEKILEMEAPVVVYVSCNPATQARDLELLDAKYKVTKVQPVDMFPHTHHIENIVQLKLKTK